MNVFHIQTISQNYYSTQSNVHIQHIIHHIAISIAYYYAFLYIQCQVFHWNWAHFI